MSFIIVALVALVFIIIYQIARASEYTATLRGEEKVFKQTNRLIAISLVVFFLLSMWGIYACHMAMIDRMLPQSASDHGVEYDFMFKWTLIITGIVFFLTQALLFWFAWRYQNTGKRAAFYFAHNNKLELIWTTIPAIAMAVLVAIGLKNWFAMTSQAPANSQVVEVVGKQFNWIMRYPGKDGALGKRNFRNINDANNVLGEDWNDKANEDDIIVENGELHLVKGHPVKLIIGSRDVIHDVGLSDFRMKMDAVPGITTTIWFTPIVSSAEMKRITGNPDYIYELSCDQMCGKGHYSMRGTIIVHDTEAELQTWMDAQKPYYVANVLKPAPADSTKAAPVPVADTTKKISMKY